MKTGECKYGERCKFHHPIDRSAPTLSAAKQASQENVKLTLAGLPRREVWFIFYPTIQAKKMPGFVSVILESIIFSVYAIVILELRQIEKVIVLHAKSFWTLRLLSFLFIYVICMNNYHDSAQHYWSRVPRCLAVLLLTMLGYYKV